MYGAIIGDMVGSPYEFDQGRKVKDFGPLFIKRSVFTDDSVMTVAVAEALMKIKLLKRYDLDKFTFGTLKDKYGIYAVRGPRGITNSLSSDLNKN